MVEVIPRPICWHHGCDEEGLLSGREMRKVIQQITRSAQAGDTW